MPQLTKGARTALDQVAACAADIRAELAVADAKVKSNPELAQRRIDDALAALAHLMRVVDEDLTPLLERQAPQYERRLAELEQRIARLEQPRSVIDFPARKAE